MIGCKRERQSIDPTYPKTPWKREEHNYKANSYSIEKLYELPLIILVNEHTASAAEHATFIMRKRLNSIVIGERTAGLFSPYTPLQFMNSRFNFKEFSGGQFELKDEGETLLITISEGVYKFGEGETEEKGLEPDIELSTSEMADDLVPIEKAMEILEEGDINEHRKEYLREVNCN